MFLVCKVKKLPKISEENINIFNNFISSASLSLRKSKQAEIETNNQIKELKECCDRLISDFLIGNKEFTTSIEDIRNTKKEDAKIVEDILKCQNQFERFFEKAASQTEFLKTELDNSIKFRTGK